MAHFDGKFLYASAIELNRIMDDVALQVERQGHVNIQSVFENHPLVTGRPGIGHNQPSDDALSTDQKELIWKHYPLIKKLAKQYSSDNPTILDDLLTVGIDRAYQLVRKWDPRKGVTFGKFIKNHLRGAMRDHSKGARKIVSGMDEDKLDWIRWGRIAPRTPKADSLDDMDRKKAWSRADRRTGDFFRGERIHYSEQSRDAERQLLSGMMERYQAAGGTTQPKETATQLTPELLAIARLNKRQERVYRECVENDTPIDTVARHIGTLEGKTVDVSQVSRIKRQAIRRVNEARAALSKSVK